MMHIDDLSLCHVITHKILLQNHHVPSPASPPSDLHAQVATQQPNISDLLSSCSLVY